MSNAIGGYFELEFPAPTPPLHPGVMEFQSARAAFLALLRARRPHRVRMPYYMCRTMFDSLRQADVDVAFYHIDEQFRIADNIALEKDEWLLYPNYFGLQTEQVASVLARFDSRQVVIDSSQALFAPPLECLATIYSPRKFLGIPDGGWMISTVPVDAPEASDDGSYERALALLKRAAFSPEEAYAEHHRAEMTLFHQEPRSMSALTRRVLSSVDFGAVRHARNTNFAYLHARLGRFNRLSLDACKADGPLCYPLLTDATGLRKYLISKRIFVPTYWTDVLNLVDEAALEAKLVQGIVPLPCDQRYRENDMNRVVSTCLEFFMES